MKQPFDMPVRGAREQQFEPQRLDYSAPEASGRIGGVQAGFPLWSGIWTLTDMTPEKSDEWRAFMASLRGSVRRFLGRDRQRPYPKAYSSGVLGFSGSASSWSQVTNADGDCELTLHGLPAGFVLSQGDYVGFQWTATESDVAGLTWHALVRTVEAATANGSGVVTVAVEPSVPLAVPPGATAHLDNPKCVMVLVPGQSSLDAVDRRGAIRGGTIVGVQDLRS